MEVPAARLEDGLQLRDLLAQLVMPRVAGRTGGGPASAAGPASSTSLLAGTTGASNAPSSSTPGTSGAQDPAQQRPPTTARSSPRQVALPRTRQARPDPAASGAARARDARPAPTSAAPNAASNSGPSGDVGPSPALIDTAARHLVRGDCAALEALLATRDGSRAAIAEAVLAPVARRLGLMWEDDDASFAEVSAGLGLLSRRFAALPGITARDRLGTGEDTTETGSILLVAAPGDTHVFGLSVVGAAFEEAGWTVMCHPAASRAEIIEQVASRWIDVLAITVSWTHAMRSVPDLVAAARLASLNPGLRVLAGGGAVAQLDGACAALHADAVAVSAAQAVAVAQQMLPPRATPV